MKRKIIYILTVFSLFISIFSISVIFVFQTRLLYYFDLTYFINIPSSIMSTKTALANYNAVMDYLSVFNFEEIKTVGIYMSEETRGHFRDVKIILNIIYLLGFIFTTSFIILRRYYKKNYQKGDNFFKSVIIIFIVIGLLASSISLVGFDKAFTIFHQILFFNDSWMISPIKDPIILVFNQIYFLHATFLIIIYFILISFGGFFFEKYYKNFLAVTIRIDIEHIIN